MPDSKNSNGSNDDPNQGGRYTITVSCRVDGDLASVSFTTFKRCGRSPCCACSIGIWCSPLLAGALQQSLLFCPPQPRRHTCFCVPCPPNTHHDFGMPCSLAAAFAQQTARVERLHVHTPACACCLQDSDTADLGIQLCLLQAEPGPEACTASDWGVSEAGHQLYARDHGGRP